ncbi:Acylamino-acid-releasing enzyme [Strongyloides ratti]|uniref:acylaminoacyl-peptidase n=1 Tax=Strongyloides ratti TaxID=34506 RepID=A0A090LDH3_STRRB|nr:Acylamino-acid-releasing enzyme [Strongyloides ratti]CEF67807.1 Acylamino-acid-releasing enzyme [Strongyloides ratti]
MLTKGKEVFQIIDVLKKTYSRLSKIRIPTGARCFLNDDNKSCTVEVTYSQRSVEIDTMLKQRRIFFFNSSMKSPTSFTSYIGETDNTTTYSIDNKKKAVFFSKKKNDNEQFLIQILNNVTETVIDTFELSSKIHGKPILSGEFGTFSLSQDGSKVLYSAEKKISTSKFFDNDVDWNDEKKLEESNVGQKFILNESFGEQLNEIYIPTLCLLNVENGKIEVINELIKGENVSPLYSLLTNDSKFIISFVLSQTQLKEGKIFCNNRPGKLIIYNIETKESSIILENKSIECLINSPCGQFVYFMMREPFGPHNSCLSLNELNLSNKEIHEIIPIKNLENIEDDNTFPGFFMPSYGQRSWSNDGKNLIISTLWKCKLEIVSVDIKCQSVERLTNISEVKGSWTLYDVCNDYIISSLSSPNIAHEMYVGKFNDNNGKKISWMCLENSNNKDLCDKELINNDYERLYFDIGKGMYECIFIKPKNFKELNLAVCVHGGPHGISLLSLPRRDVQLMLNSGYAVLLVNYHGSIGYGKSFVDELPGKCGTLEIDEIHHAKNQILSLYPFINKNNVCLFGGSHGGFAVTSLIGKYPNDFKACVALNPVLDFQTSHDISDIADWAVYESLNKIYNWGKYLTLEERKEMFMKSPISLVENVTTPYLLLIGEKDLRVVPHYRPYIRTLQARKVLCKVLTYPKSNHSLQEVDVEADYSINTILWFMGIH